MLLVAFIVFYIYILCMVGGWGGRAKNIEGVVYEGREGFMIGSRVVRSSHKLF